MTEITEQKTQKVVRKIMNAKEKEVVRSMRILKG